MTPMGGEVAYNTIYQLICSYEADGCGSIGFADFLHLMTHRVTQRDTKS
jgi:hypothetical protein